MEQSVELSYDVRLGSNANISQNFMKNIRIINNFITIFLQNSVRMNVIGTISIT